MCDGMMKNPMVRILTLVVLLVAGIATYVPVQVTAQTETRQVPVVGQGAAQSVARTQQTARVIPTTSNPTINTANAGVRTMANTSFEVTDFICSLDVGTWAYIRQEYMAGWFTAHPLEQESCNSSKFGPASYRPIELNMRTDAPDGDNVASLNASVASFLYQKLCVKNGESFDFEFYHNAGVAGVGRTDIASFRLGIPSGLPLGSVAEDTYSREVIEASTTANSSGVATAASKTDGTGTTSGAASVVSGWGKYSGTHTLPSTGYDGIRNIGFFGVASIGPGAGNLLDKISLGLEPLMDLGASRDATIIEGAAGSVKIRINGRVGAGTTVILRKSEGTAVSDSDFSIGTVSAGALGTASVTHTSGSNMWVITVPAGDYDGGIFPSNNRGGLTIPVNYTYDAVNDTGEYVMFKLGAPGADGASVNWDMSDPTCDGSFKDDGVVYTITNVAPPQIITMDLSDVTGKNFHVDGGTSAPFSIASQATVNSGLALTYTSTTTGVCTVTSSGTVTLVGPGTCTIRAAQPGGTDGAGIVWAAATSVTSSFVVSNIAPTPQTITFGALSNKVLGAAPFSVSATASSRGIVTYTSTTTGVCTVTSAGVVTLRSSGICTIRANSAMQIVSGTLYDDAPPVSQSFTVSAAQTITFNPTDKVYNVANYPLTATTSSSLPVTYTSSTPSICTVTPSGTVDLRDVGVCTITATAAAGTAGGVTYGAATVTKSFNATPVPQTLTFPALPEWRLYEGNEITPAGVASSGLPVTYTTTTPLVCTVVGGKIMVVGLGKCTVKATVAAGTKDGVKYAASSEVQREFWITDTQPTATFTPTKTHTPTPTNTPTPIPLLLKKGAVGGSFVLGLLQNDTLVTWGMGREGQTTIPPCCGANIQDIAVGTNFALALKGGRVYGWGANTRGQLNFPTTTQSGIKAVAAGGAHGLALTTAGKVIAWGENGFMQAKVPALSKVVTSVVGGSNHTVVLFSDGTVQAWGANASKQSSPPTTLTGITQIAAGLDHNLALKSNGTVIGWGNNAYGQSAIPRTAIDIKQVSAGTQFSMAVKKDGSVVAWGRNDYNQTVIPPVYTDIYSAFAGYANTILGLRSGRIIVLGDQNNGVAVSRTPTKTATVVPPGFRP